jgi:hypothetical protein
MTSFVVMLLVMMMHGRVHINEIVITHFYYVVYIDIDYDFLY